MYNFAGNAQGTGVPAVKYLCSVQEYGVVRDTRPASLATFDMVERTDSNLGTSEYITRSDFDEGADLSPSK